MNKNKNLHWVNAVKLLCMVIVFFNHSEIYSEHYVGWFDTVYIPFFVNAFFFVSGYLLFRKQLTHEICSLSVGPWMKAWGGQFLKNILFKLVIPSILFATFVHLPKVYLRGLDFSVESLVADTILGRCEWFTSALTVAELIIFVLLLTRVKNVMFYVICGVCIMFFSTYIHNTGIVFFNDIYLPWHYKAGMSAVVLLAAGGLYSKFEDKLDNLLRGYWIVPLIILYIALAYYRKDNVCVNWGPITIKSLLVALLGVYCFVRLCKLIPSSKFIDYWGVRSISLYFFCGSCPNAYAVLLNRFMHPSLEMLLVLFVLSFVTVLGVAYLLNEHLPFVYDLRKIRK